MKNQPVLEEHYKTMVYTNTEMDELRREECLCINCSNVHCKIAHDLYSTCKQFNVALMVTRCPNFTSKQETIT